MLENLHAYFPFFNCWLYSNIAMEVLLMTNTDEARLMSELKIMELNGLKPNFAELGRKYDLDYRTVKKYYEGYEGKPKTRERTSMLDAHVEEIKNKMAISRISKKGVYEFLIDKYGEEEIGSYSNFNKYCKKNKITIKSVSTGGKTLFETEWGELCELDWKEDIHLVSRNGELFVVNIFHAVLKFSRYSYIELTLSKEQQVVFRCLINAFKAFGGVPKRILFDNMSTVMDTTVKPKRVNLKFKQFANDMGFEVNSCKARHAYTKGTNESRKKIFDWLRAYNNEFDTFEELQEIVELIQAKMNMEICQGTGMTPQVLFYKEKEYLNPLPNKSVMENYIAPTKVTVSPQQLIIYKENKYSVDKKYVGESVYLEEFDNKLQIYYKGKLIQIHPISKNPINYIEEHYKQTMQQVIKFEKMDDVVTKNLKMFDSLLEARKVSISKEEASLSNDAMLTYLLSYNSKSADTIKRILYKLNKEKRELLLNELRKLIPFIINEEQFFYYFDDIVNIHSIETVRISFWEFDLVADSCMISKEGYKSISNDFKEICEKKYKKLKEVMDIK